MPFGGGSSPVSYTTKKLTYPIFDAEFDPYSRGYLIVAGGGGESHSGVPNKISLLDVSSREALEVVTELDLSTDEDSPQSLASLTTKQGLITLVGISSSVADQKTGKNEHLRSFDVEFPPSKRAKTGKDDIPEEKASRIAPFGKTALFTPPTPKNSQTYQRLLRLSPVQSRDVASKRIGAVSSADAAVPEITLFDATTFAPTSASLLQRLSLETEAEDLDLWENSEGSFSLVFCNHYEIFLYKLECNFSTKTNKPSTPAPVRIHNIPNIGIRPKMRCLRWLTEKHIVVLQTRQNGGSELVVLEVDKDRHTSRILSGKLLPKSMGAGARLAICRLDADPGSGERQIIVAVAGQSKSIHVFTLNHQPDETEGYYKQLTELRNFTVLDTSDQHPQPIYKLAFSNFFSPRQPADSNMSVASSTQYVNLASVSSGYTVSVESFALTSVPTSPSLTSSDGVAKRQNGNRPAVRWVLSSRTSEFISSYFGLYVIGFVILVIAFLAQTFMTSGSKPTTGAGAVLPISSISSAWSDVSSSAGLSETLGSSTSSIASLISSATSTASAAVSSATDATKHKLSDLFHLHKEHLTAENPTKAILMEMPENPFAHTDVSATLHHNIEEAKQQGAKTFEELSEKEKKRWLRYLSETGHWAEGMPRVMLQSVVFSTWADVAGGALRDAVLQG